MRPEDQPTQQFTPVARDSEDQEERLESVVDEVSYLSSVLRIFELRLTRACHIAAGDVGKEEGRVVEVGYQQGYQEGLEKALGMLLEEKENNKGRS